MRLAYIHVKPENIRDVYFSPDTEKPGARWAAGPWIALICGLFGGFGLGAVGSH